jgi:hypothetical protein
MRIDHGGAHILVDEELLDGADVLAPFQQVCRERMADGGDGGPGYRIPFRARGSAGGIPIARPTHGWRWGTSGPGHTAVAPGPNPQPGHLGASSAP